MQKKQKRKQKEKKLEIQTHTLNNAKHQAPWEGHRCFTDGQTWTKGKDSIIHTHIHTH